MILHLMLLLPIIPASPFVCFTPYGEVVEGELGAILDFNRKSSDHIESVSQLFVGVVLNPFSENFFLNSS